jgi:hypothetical protein
MQTQTKPVVAINTRQITLEFLAMAVRALAAGVVVSVGAALLIVAAIVLGG